MPNIILTNQCNLKCPYCFANNIINNQTSRTDITIKQFENILKWLEITLQTNNNEMKIGLIGGEPTLYPYFNYILKRIIIFQNLYPQVNFVLFTNGIELYKYIDNIPKQLAILINYNSPKILTVEQQQKLNKSLTNINKTNIALGCNIYQQLDNYNYFWDAVNKYQINIVRVSVTAPISQEQKKNKVGYYLSLKEKFLNFMENAILNNCQVIFDCNQIPLCYFSDNEINKYNLQNRKQCIPAIDITQNFNFIPCFGIHTIIDKNFKNLTELYQYIIDNYHIPLLKDNSKEECSSCQYYIKKECQNGCFSFQEKK